MNKTKLKNHEEKYLHINKGTILHFSLLCLLFVYAFGFFHASINQYSAFSMVFIGVNVIFIMAGVLYCIAKLDGE